MKGIKKTIATILVLLASLTLSAQKGDSVLIDAVQLYETGNYQKAKSALKEIIKAYPDNDAAWYYLGMAEARTGDTGSAVTCLKKAVDLDGSNFWYRDRLASVYELRGETDMVIDMYEGILKQFPGKTQVYYSLLSLYVDRKQFEKALGCIDAIEGEIGQNEQTVRTRYDLLRALNRPEQALEALLAYNRNFASAPVLSMIGDYYISEYLDSLALASYDEALSIQSSYVPAILGKAEVFRITRRYDDYFSMLDGFVADTLIQPMAKCMYLDNVTRSLDPNFMRVHMGEFDSLVSKGLEVHPSDSTMLMTAGSYYFITGRKDRARPLLEKNAELYPNSLSCVATCVDGLARMEEWEAVKELSAKAEKNFPNELGFMEYGTMAMYNLDDFEGVIAKSGEMLKKFPRDTAVALRCYSSIGDMQYKLGRSKAAYKSYDKALKINKDYCPVLNNYAWYLCQEGILLKKAAKMSKRTIELEPDNATYLDTYGWILHLQQKDKEAKPHFKHAMLYGGKDSAVILCHYAEVLYKLGEYDLAKVYWNQAIAKNDGTILNLEEKVRKKLEAVGK